MANELGTNPITVDTAMASAYFNAIKVSSAIWMSPPAAGNQLIVLDRNGKTILNVTAPVANEDVDIAVLDNWWRSGFQVTQIDGGIFAIFLD